MTKDRKRGLTANALEYIATHMEAVLDVEGPWEMVSNQEESDFMEKLFHREADKIRDRAKAIRNRGVP